MADEDSWDADSFEPDEPIKKASGNDKWEGEDEEEDVKDNWDEEEVEEKEDEEKSAGKPTDVKPSEKKKLSEKIKEKENLQRQKEEELQKRAQTEESPDHSPDMESTQRPQLQEDSDVESASDTSGVTSNHVTGIDAISPSSKDDFTAFEKLLKDKITPYDKSVHYCNFLESLFRNLCTPLEVEELKKISTGLTVLLNEKQKQEKTKGKKKKKGVVPGGGLKAKKKDDLADYGEFDGGYTQDYEDFM